MEITYITEVEDGVERFIPTLDGERVDGYDHYILQRPVIAGAMMLNWYAVVDMQTDKSIAVADTLDKVADDALDSIWDDLVAIAADAADVAQTHADGHAAWTRG